MECVIVYNHETVKVVHVDDTEVTVLWFRAIGDFEVVAV